MPITFQTDPSGRRVLVSVASDPRNAAALAELLPALRWTGTDEVVIDLSELETIDLRLAVVLAQAKRRNVELGRRLSIVCPDGTDAGALQTVGLTGPGVLCRSLADARWPTGPSAAQRWAGAQQLPSRPVVTQGRPRQPRRALAHRSV
jgi:anti-anti-sigma regulatory factor